MLSEYRGSFVDSKTGDFRVYTPVTLFEKADAPEGERRRIGGLITTETKDRQGEVVLQRGLNLEPFIERGYLNRNHSKDETDIVGYPESVKFVAKGEKLPDGTCAPANGHWMEGRLLEGNGNDPVDRMWRIGQSLQKSGGKRRYGYSIEGKVLRRAGVDGKIIAEAEVHHTAVTHCPVNPDAGMAILAKALLDPDERPAGSPPADQDLRESLDSESGRAVLPQSLESKLHSTEFAPAGPRKKPPPIKFARRLSKAEAIEWLGEQFPDATYKSLKRIFEAAAAQTAREAGEARQEK